MARHPGSGSGGYSAARPRSMAVVTRGPRRAAPRRAGRRVRSPYTRTAAAAPEAPDARRRRVGGALVDSKDTDRNSCSGGTGSYFSPFFTPLG